MEIKNYFKIIKKYLAVFLIVVILGGISAFAFSKYSPQTYTATTTFIINKEASLTQSNAPYYIFDNYYNVQSAGLYSKIVATWFESPSVVKEIYTRAGIELPDVPVNKLSKVFKAVREDPATIHVSITGKDKTEVDKMIRASIVVLQGKTDELGKNEQSFYKIAQFEPIVAPDKPDLVLNTVIGLIAGIMFGLIIVFGIEYFKSEK